MIIANICAAQFLAEQAQTGILIHTLDLIKFLENAHNFLMANLANENQAELAGVIR